MFKLLSLLLTFILFGTSGFGQLSIQAGEHYLQDQNLQKLHVNAEDHSVWVINDVGKVYYKEAAESSFSLFQPTAHLNVTEVVGYNMNEMYFLVNGELLYFKNKINQPITFAGTPQRINTIMPFYDRLEIKTDKSLDYLMIGFDTGRANLKRNQSVIGVILPGTEMPDWRVHYYGLKTYSSSYDNLGYCYNNGRRHHSYVTQTIFETNISDQSPYPSEQTAVLYLDGYLPLTVWATNEGLFLKNAHAGCLTTIYKRLDGQAINAVEVVRSLGFYNNDRFLIAATNEGLQYTPNHAIINSEIPNESVKFEEVPGLASVKFTKVMAETSFIGRYSSSRNAYCEKAVWATTEQGIYRLYLNFDQAHFDNMNFYGLGYSKAPSNNNYDSPVFSLCSGETIKITNTIPVNASSQILIQWFKDGEELHDFRGERNPTLSSAGIYRCKVTMLCENIAISSNDIRINYAAPPEISFNYPPEINICPSDSYTLQTEAIDGYSYRWYKDNSLIQGASRNYYLASSTGDYRVEVSNCGNSFLSSSIVKINVTAPVAPIIVSNKVAYCHGETATLQVDNNEGFMVKWYLNNRELTNYFNAQQINVTDEGIYTAEFINIMGCAKMSSTFVLQFNEVPIIAVSRSKEGQLCMGENLRLQAISSLPNSEFLWSTGETTPAINISQTGVYWVKAKSSSGCVVISGDINVMMNPAISITDPENAKICVIGGEKVILEAERGFVYYTWNGVKSSRNYLEVSNPGDYLLTVENQYGCKASITYKVLPYCKEVLAPNTFSPNGDSINDVWKIAGLENDSAAEISIYGRSGNLLYLTTGKYPFWDGMANGKQVPIGTYYYVIKTKNSVKPISGTITVIK